MLILFFCFGGDPCCSSFFLFERGIRVTHCLFLFWEGDPCCSSFFDLRGGSVLLIIFCFGREIRVAHRFFFSLGR